jgi:hypothetical protein
MAKTVHLELKFGESYVKGDFSPEVAKSIMDGILKNDQNGSIKITAYPSGNAPEAPKAPETTSEPYKQEFYHRAHKYDYEGAIRKEMDKGKKFIRLRDIVKNIDPEKEYLGTNSIFTLRKIAKRLGYERVYGGFIRANGDEKPITTTPKIKDHKPFKHDYEGAFLKEAEVAKGKVAIEEIAKRLGMQRTNLHYPRLVQIAKKHGYAKVYGGFRKLQPEPVAEHKQAFVPHLAKRNLIPVAKIETAAMYLMKDGKQVKIYDILKAMNSNPFNSDNPEYQRVYWVLANFVSKGIVMRNSYIANGIKWNLYSLIKKEDRKAEESQKPVKAEIPPDTTEDILKKILNIYGSFNAVALMQVQNKYGYNYSRYSAKGLFDWMCSNTDFLMKLTEKKISVGGSGDYRFIQVLGG